MHALASPLGSLGTTHISQPDVDEELSTAEGVDADSLTKKRRKEGRKGKREVSAAASQSNFDEWREARPARKKRKKPTPE